jgi:plasmid stability protein
MTAQSLTISVPEALYERLRQRADATGRTVEGEVLDLLAAATSENDDVSPELREMLDSLALLDDEALRQAARSRLPDDVSARLEALHLKRQSADLSEAEAQEAARLLRQYDRTMLIRAEAAVLLKQRGHDVSDLAKL